jgi:hypothetical protein
MRPALLQIKNELITLPWSGVGAVASMKRLPDPL